MLATDNCHTSPLTRTNPVVGNPSGVSGPAAQPGTVPGLGNPDAGADRGTPSVNLETLLDRLDDRSNGRGPSVG